MILDFRLCQRRGAIKTPVHRLEALGQMSVINNFPQRTNNVRFESEVHGQVRIIPVTKYAQTDKVRLLTFHLTGGVLAAFITKCFRINFLSSLANFLLDLMFNRQAMAVPTRHIGGIKPA